MGGIAIWFEEVNSVSAQDSIHPFPPKSKFNGQKKVGFPEGPLAQTFRW